MSYFLVLGIFLWAYMTFWFLVSVLKKRNDVADIAWGIGFVLLAWVSLFYTGGLNIRGILVSILVSIWGVRLAWHIQRRNRGKIEDYRYSAWREEWGKWFYLRSYFQVYLLQGVLLFLIAIPVLVINSELGGTLGFLDLLGVFVWIIGFYFESVGDFELAEFIKNPENKGKLMQTGLWRFTRHPNYFGEVLGWWGIYLIALNVAGSFFSIIGPLTITVLILKVSGIPLLEKKMEMNDSFAEYKRKTNMFIPWWPK